jgi:hypothetical protein
MQLQLPASQEVYCFMFKFLSVFTALRKQLKLTQDYNASTKSEQVLCL